MRLLLIASVFLVVVTGLIWLGFYFRQLIITKPDTVFAPTEYTAVMAYHDDEKNVCFSDSEKFNTNFDEKVTIVYEHIPDAAGMWTPLTNTITLTPEWYGLDIDTVSHEVSHLVDTFMRRYDFEDEHFAAYIQGYWTRCVWKIVEEDREKLLNQ